MSYSFKNGFHSHIEIFVSEKTEEVFLAFIYEEGINEIKLSGTSFLEC